ncbi:hypothetical protein DL768_009386 [Monosporascus sp. mg162]|nr:hypothetical protein DL768_009386 [Monosporascus sp. mg162]
MSGLEVISALSGVVGILDVTIRVSRAIKDSRNLPQAFREVEGTLPLIQDTLRTASARLSQAKEDADSSSANTWESIGPAVQRCKGKAEQLKKIMQGMELEPDAARLKRYHRAIRALGRGGLVEELLKGMAEDAQLIAANHAIKAATEGRVDALRKAIEDLSKVPQSAPTTLFAHQGAVNQFNNTGTGTQNNNTGDGKQFIAATINFGYGW